MRHYILLPLCLVIFLYSVNAQDEMPEQSGFIALEELSLFKDIETSLEVQIGESMIALVASTAEKDSPEFARVLRKLKQLRSFSFDLSAIPRNKIDEYLEQVNTRLLNERWEIVYRMREPETTANIYMKTVAGEVAGMTIYSIDRNDQVILINIVGSVSLEDISQLAEQFGLPDISP